MGAESGGPEKEIAADVYTYLYTSYGQDIHTSSLTNL
jgi:hypothetical protein